MTSLSGIMLVVMRACPQLLRGSVRSLQHGTNHSTARLISLLSLVGVEYGGWALLGFLTGRGQLGKFREQFFRAGHAHAGVLLVLSLHLARGQKDRSSVGTVVTRTGGLLLAAALIMLAIGLVL